MYLKRELEGSKYSNASLIESNANLQVEIDSMNNHIRVVSHQNDQLTREIDTFVTANEKIREKLDRKGRVHVLRTKNENQIRESANFMSRGQERSRSPMGQYGSQRQY